MSGIACITKNFSGTDSVEYIISVITNKYTYIQCEATVGGSLEIHTRVSPDFAWVQVGSTSTIAGANAATLLNFDTTLAAQVKILFTPTGATVGKVGIFGK